MAAWVTQFGRQRHPNNPGKFNCALILRASTAAQGIGGDEQPDWAGPAMTARRNWRQTSHRESVMDGGKFSGASGVWEIPWVPELTSEHRVEFGSRYYRIIDIENLEERNRELHLYVVEDEGAKGLGG